MGERLSGPWHHWKPGHDGWVVGDEAAVAFEFESAETHACG